MLNPHNRRNSLIFSENDSIKRVRWKEKNSLVLYSQYSKDNNLIQIQKINYIIKKDQWNRNNSPLAFKIKRDKLNLTDSQTKNDKQSRKNSLQANKGGKWINIRTTRSNSLIASKNDKWINIEKEMNK